MAPRHANAHPNASAALDAAAAGSGPFVLAVDDEEDICYTLRAIAEYAGWRFHGFADGPDLLAYLDGKGATTVASATPVPYNQESADLFLVDYHLPSIDGVTLIGLLRRRYPDVPILVLTVDESQELADRCLTAGASDFALKPIKAPDLIARVRVHLIRTDAKKPVEPSPSLLNRHQPAPSGLPKGFQETTLTLLLAALEKAGQSPQSAEELSADAGLAVPTVYRYLQYLVTRGLVKVVEEYGRVGRPRRRYALKGKVRTTP